MCHVHRQIRIKTNDKAHAFRLSASHVLVFMISIILNVFSLRHISLLLHRIRKSSFLSLIRIFGILVSLQCLSRAFIRKGVSCILFQFGQSAGTGMSPIILSNTSSSSFQIAYSLFLYLSKLNSLSFPQIEYFFTVPFS